MVLLLRITGMRMRSKLNAFDLVAPWPRVPPWHPFRPPRAASSTEPALLLRNGELLHRAMRRKRLKEDEVLSAIRAAGKRSF